MITLSKSKLLKFAELSELQIDGRSEFAYTNRLEHFAELVLSDLDVCMEHVPENEEPRQQLAAEQLNNKLLREALEFLNVRIVTMDLGGVVERALSLHASTEALDAYVAEKVKKYGDEVASQKHCYAEAVTHYEKQLAAEQLNNKRLRVALEAVIKVHGYESGIPVEALAQPSDTSALDVYVAEKVKEARK